MSKKQNKKQQQQVENTGKNVVKMKFTEHKYYNDLNNPIFFAGKVYEIEGDDQIQRWLKRGGIIVSGELKLPEQDAPNPSVLIPEGNKPKEEKQEQEPVAINNESGDSSSIQIEEASE